MLTMAYGSLGFVGYRIYRGMQKNAAHQQAAAPTP